MKNIFKLLAIAAVFTACEDVEPIVYSGAEGEETFLSFSSGSYDLPVLRDGEGALEVTLNSSTVSSVDRTYNIEFVELGSNADPSTYVLPTSVTIPAGSYQGTLLIQGMDNNLVETSAKSFVFRVTGLNDESIDNAEATVNIFEVCDLGADFTGQYRYTQITEPLTTTGGQDIYLFEQNSIVNLTVGNNIYQRKFSANLWPGFFGDQVTMTLTLSCDEVLTSKVSLDYGCTEGVNFVVGKPTTNGSYIEGNDDVINVRVTEDAAGSCLAVGRPLSFRLTKIE